MDGIYFASYADDNTPYTIGNDMEDVIFKLQNSSKMLFQWFEDNKNESIVEPPTTPPPPFIKGGMRFFKNG